MPRKEINDYIFYKIVCLDKDLDLCYVGSTANWKARNCEHRLNCNYESSKKYNIKLYQTIRENGGWDNFKMIQIDTREQLNKREAEAIEEEYRQQLRANMNSRRCFITEEQEKELNKERCKNYRKNNIDVRIKADKDYYEENKDKILAKMKVKVECECGCIVRKSDLAKHRKTDKHLNLINAN